MVKHKIAAMLYGGAALLIMISTFTTAQYKMSMRRHDAYTGFYQSKSGEISVPHHRHMDTKRPESVLFFSLGMMGMAAGLAAGMALATAAIMNFTTAVIEAGHKTANTIALGFSIYFIAALLLFHGYATAVLKEVAGKRFHEIDFGMAWGGWMGILAAFMAMGGFALYKLGQKEMRA